MTTAADLLRRFVARAPEGAKGLELLTLHGKPGEDVIASWPADEARDAETLRGQIIEAGQEHCDAEGEPLILKVVWVNKSSAIQGRRIRFAPSEGSTALTGQGPSDPLVKELLHTIREQQRVMFGGVETMVKACKQVLEIASEQTRMFEARTRELVSHQAEVVDSAERDMRKRALAVVLERAPDLLDLLIHAGASRALNGHGKIDPGEATPTQ